MGQNNGITCERAVQMGVRGALVQRLAVQAAAQHTDVPQRVLVAFSPLSLLLSSTIVSRLIFILSVFN